MAELLATSSALKRLLRFRRTVRLKRLPRGIFGSAIVEFFTSPSDYYSAISVNVRITTRVSLLY